MLPYRGPSPSPPPSSARRTMADGNNRRSSPPRGRSRSRGPSARAHSLSPSRSRSRSRSRSCDRSRSKNLATRGRSWSRFDDDRRRRRADSRDSRSSSSSYRSRSRSRSRSRRRSLDDDDAASDRKARKAKETAKEKEERKKSEIKASAGFLGAVAVAAFAAHKLWPKGYLYGGKEEWESRPIPKKVKEETAEKRVEIRQEVDKLRGHRPTGNGELSPTSISSTAATYGSIRAGGQDFDPSRRRPELLQRPAGNGGGLSPTSISSTAATVGSSRIGGQELDSPRRHVEFAQRDDNRVYYESTETRRYPASGYRPDRGGPPQPLRNPSDHDPKFEDREDRLLDAPPPRRGKIYYQTSSAVDRQDDERYAAPVGSDSRQAAYSRLVQKTKEEVQVVRRSSPTRIMTERTSSSKVLFEDDPRASRDADRPPRYLDDAGRRYADDRDHEYDGGRVRETRRHEYASVEPPRREQARHETAREPHRSSPPRDREHWDRERVWEGGRDTERPRERRPHQESAVPEYAQREMTVRNRHMSPDPVRREAERERAAHRSRDRDWDRDWDRDRERARARDKDRERETAYQRAGRNAHLGNVDTHLDGPGE
ncbi:hypothetical protein MAPG_07901 [Magnaporthiopsis poae ATCC 64411]|uniref:Uncharacterized protein n=1 Tax=Magnaporthiopsis poae (strain ATCC 64411 / 73-15) TaxID=644358 RepID=A0A0C4E5X3_MAGP6|nr:hypothetical protein MAPG_07901 [Magnaporthiopsis poae ATCC 64411]